MHTHTYMRNILIQTNTHHARKGAHILKYAYTYAHAYTHHNMHMQHPAVALLFERCVITASFPAAAMMHSLGLATMVRV